MTKTPLKADQYVTTCLRKQAGLGSRITKALSAARSGISSGAPRKAIAWAGRNREIVGGTVGAGAGFLQSQDEYLRPGGALVNPLAKNLVVDKDQRLADITTPASRTLSTLTNMALGAGTGLAVTKRGLPGKAKLLAVPAVGASFLSTPLYEGFSKGLDTWTRVGTELDKLVTTTAPPGDMKIDPVTKAVTAFAIPSPVASTFSEGDVLKATGTDGRIYRVVVDGLGPASKGQKQITLKTTEHGFAPPQGITFTKIERPGSLTTMNEFPKKFETSVQQMKPAIDFAGRLGKAMDWMGDPKNRGTIGAVSIGTLLLLALLTKFAIGRKAPVQQNVDDLFGMY